MPNKRARLKEIKTPKGEYRYGSVYFEGKNYYLHRLAFLLMREDIPEYVDHINGDTSDNRWCNLRPCSHRNNLRNTRIRSDNTSGYKEVSWDKTRGKWISYIHLGGRKLHLGGFPSIENAHDAYKKAAIKYFGGLARYD